MKTAKEWIDFTYPGSLFGCEEMIKKIQLDAMKEGMRRAATICDVQDADYSHSRCYQNHIISAAEKLTEKDL